jgi:biotin operon repressor
VTITPSAPAGVRVAQRLECVACCRPYGRRRAPRIPGDAAGGALIDCAELVVCDQCWHVAGGTAAITTRLAGAGMEPALVFDPAVDALLQAAAEYDQLHPIDRLLVESGVRWSVLRHIAVPARMQLAGEVLRRTAPDATRSADSGRVWLDVVEARIRAQTVASRAGSSAMGGAGFTYNAKRRRWWRIAHLLACAADRDARPLTWVTQEEIAAVVGCSTRTVRRAVAWLRAEGLLFEVVPGCRLPQQHVPDGETAIEATARRARLAAAVAAEDAAIARARARSVLAGSELDAVDNGHTGTDAAAAAQLILPDDIIAALALDTGPESASDDALVNLSPVYELRVPAPPDLQRRPAPVPAALPGEQPVPLPEPYPDSSPLTSINTDWPDPNSEFVRPPQVSNQDRMKSRSEQDVDKRRAPRGPYEGSSAGSSGPAEVDGGADAAESTPDGPTAPPEGHQQGHRQSRAVRTAQRLLRSRLDVRVCENVSVHWLAGQLRANRLLDRLLDAGWTEQDLVDLLHGAPQYTHLPRHIRSARAWIHTRLHAATPTLPPSRLRTLAAIERSSPWFQNRHRAAGAAARQTEITARRTAIDTCPLCNELGWLELGHDTPTARCTHDPATGGW